MPELKDVIDRAVEQAIDDAKSKPLHREASGVSITGASFYDKDSPVTFNDRLGALVR